MSTLLEAAKTLIKVLELEKSQIVLSMASGRALEQLEQAIAQEQHYSSRANELIEIFKDAPDVPPLLTKTDNWEPKP